MEKNNSLSFDLNDIESLEGIFNFNDIFSIVGLLSNPDKRILKITFSKDKENFDTDLVYSKLREYWKNNELTQDEWKNWEKQIQVKWKLINN